MVAASMSRHPHPTDGPVPLRESRAGSTGSSRQGASIATEIDHSAIKPVRITRGCPCTGRRVAPTLIIAEAAEIATPVRLWTASVDSPRPERPVEVEGGADQGQVGERLRVVAQGLATVAGLLGK